jgi:hypothetical protein
MLAIFRGRRFVVTGWSAKGIWLEPLVPQAMRERRFVGFADSDLIAKPDAEDLDLAVLFERGEIRAFEYPDGHTFPPGREIAARTSVRHPRSFLIH